MHLCLTFFFTAGLKEPWFVEFNGGFSQAQLDWFNEVLKSSDENQEKVIVMGRYTWGIYQDICKKIYVANVCLLKKTCSSFAALPRYACNL